MNIILTKDPCTYRTTPYATTALIDAEGDFARAVKPWWKDDARLLVVAADPDDAETAEVAAMNLAVALSKAGLPVGTMRVAENETAEIAAPLVAGSDVVWLLGGDEDARRAFCAETALADALAASADEAKILVIVREGAPEVLKDVRALPESVAAYLA